MAASDILDVAAVFVQAVASGDTSAAHGMLSSTARQAITPSDLSTQYQSLADDMGGVTGIGQPMLIMEDWPNKSEHDRAMVYVPLEGDSFSEAITVTVAEISARLCISSIEWGRP